MGRMDELWQAAGGPGLAPETNARAVKARVNAALDADPAERSIHMKQKLRCGLAVAALVAAVTTSALAVGANWDILSVFFQGDTAPAQAKTRLFRARQKLKTTLTKGGSADGTDG